MANTAADTAHTAQAVWTLACCFPARKVARMGLDSFFAHAHAQTGAEVRLLEPRDAAHALAALDPDVFLSKVTGLQASARQEDADALGALERTLGELDTARRARGVAPVLCVDPLDAQQGTLDRDVMGERLALAQADLQAAGFDVVNPRQITVESSVGVRDAVAQAGLAFPVVCKARRAGGTPAAHQMGIAFDAAATEAFEPPIVVQEFFNHNGRIFKGFAIGPHVHLLERESVPNLRPVARTVMFDSQRPFVEQLRDQGLVDDVVAGAPAAGAVRTPPDDVVQAIVAAIGRRFGISLFGFDIIQHAETRRFAVIDVNYFPGYAGVPDFDAHLLSHLEAALAAHRTHYQGGDTAPAVR